MPLEKENVKDCLRGPGSGRERGAVSGIAGRSAWATGSLAGRSSRRGGGAGCPGPQHIWALFGAPGLFWEPQASEEPMDPMPRCTAHPSAHRPGRPRLSPAPRGASSPARAQPGFIKQPQRSRRGESAPVDQFVILLFGCGRNVRDANAKSPGKSPLQQSLVVRIINACTVVPNTQLCPKEIDKVAAVCAGSGWGSPRDGVSPHLQAGGWRSGGLGGRHGQSLLLLSAASPAAGVVRWG